MRDNNFKKDLGGVKMAINKDMTIGEIIRQYPECIEILMSFGMGCVGCPASQAETLEEAAAVHGFDVDVLIKRLKEAVNE